jgi:tryptophan synthase alpha chain
LALFPYLTAGFPDPESSGHMVEAIVQGGADGIEIGIPFSDPMADGLTLQRANQKALSQGATTLTALHLAGHARRLSDRLAINFMSYYNPVLAFGEAAFCRAAAEAGADALIVPDLPPEESAPLRAACGEAGLAYIFMLSPNSTPERVRLVAEMASGFIYCVSLVGVTGARDQLASDVGEFLARVRAATSVPLVVGFGISRPEHVHALRGRADGVIVGGALADVIESAPALRRAATVQAWVQELKAAT